MEPRDFRGVAHCDCGSAPPAGQVFRYVKSTGSENRRFLGRKSADPTFPFGSFWEPEVVNSAGLVAPGDRQDQWPVQAPYDEVDLDEEAYAKHDQIPRKFARYFDQLESRRSCEGEDCMSPCAAGDKVLLQLGNLRRNATVLWAAGANAAQIEFSTGQSEGSACPVEAGCSLLRVCASADQLQCVAQEAQDR
eukprot:g30407.t1